MSSPQTRNRSGAAPWNALWLLTAACIAGCNGSGGDDGGRPPPTVTIAVQPSTIALGESATLTWSATPGSACTASGAWSGSEPTSGTRVVTPTTAGTDSFTLACRHAGDGDPVARTTVLTIRAQSVYSHTALVAHAAVSGALTTDASLVNPWGLAFGAVTPIWVANNHSGSSTIYDGNGTPQPADFPLAVELPADAAGTPFGPTGLVYNASHDFVVTEAGQSAPARFIFAGEGSRIAGWFPTVNLTRAVTMYADEGHAAYKGLAIASSGGDRFLYATDFRNRRIDVLDATYRRQVATAERFAFVDPQLPDGYAPFGIQAIANGPGGTTQLYVTYAQQLTPDDVAHATGDGLGLVDIFDANGRFVQRLVSPGERLNAPWGLALAPAEFGTLSNALLVGNVGDGKIHAYDPATGAFMGTLADATGAPFAVPGLWGLSFGNGAANQPRTTLFYAAGNDGEAGGTYGRLDLGVTPPLLGAPPLVALTGPSGNVSGTVTLTATALAERTLAGLEFFADGTTSLGVATTAPYEVRWDTTHVADGLVQITVTATDVDGNVGASPPVTLTVVNAAAP